jgi:hypothetical protein
MMRLAVVSFVVGLPALAGVLFLYCAVVLGAKRKPAGPDRLSCPECGSDTEAVELEAWDMDSALEDTKVLRVVRCVAQCGVRNI